MLLTFLMIKKVTRLLLPITKKYSIQIIFTLLNIKDPNETSNFNNYKVFRHSKINIFKLKT